MYTLNVFKVELFAGRIVSMSFAWGLPIFLSRITTEVIPNIHLHTFSLYTYRVLLLTRIFKCLQVHLNYLYLSAYQIYNSLSWYLVMWCNTAFHVYKTPQRCSQDFSRGGIILCQHESYLPDCHVIFTPCCRLFSLKKAYKWGLTGTPGPP